jgi:uncharacterized membrane protein YjfL (UPF0719 family)
MNLETIGIYLLYTGIYIAFAWILKLILDFRSEKYYKADDAIAKGNNAIALRRSGAQLGLAIAMMGVLSSGSAENLVDDILLTLLYGALATFFMVSSLMITDHFVVPGINNHQALKDKNMAVGTVEFGILIATGIIAYSSIYGESGGWLSSLIYFVVGQLLLIILVRTFEHLAHRKFEILNALYQGNTASGIYIGGKTIAYALILKSAIMNHTTMSTPLETLSSFALLAVIGMLLLYLAELIVDWVIITSTNVQTILKDNQVSPALQLSATKIGLALILSSSIL